MLARKSNLVTWSVSVVAAVAWLLCRPALTHATSFDFQLPTGAPAASYFVPGCSMYQDWVGVTATANFPNMVYQDQNGLGVTQWTSTTNPQVNGPSEELQFQFTSNVLLDGLTFTSLGNAPPSWAMIFFGTSIVYWSPLQGGNASDTGTYYLDLTGLAVNQRIGSIVSVAAFMPTDSFQIGGITVDQVPGAPLPTSFGAGMVMLGGLAAVKILRRPVRVARVRVRN